MSTLQGESLVTASTGAAVAVQKSLGAGGQGEVFSVEVAGKPYALKWYHPTAATEEQRRSIEDLVRRPAPAPSFLWPLELVRASSGVSFGYLMNLREPRFRATEDLMSRRVSSTFRALLTAGYQLATSFFELHARGLCYRDISFGNVFFDPATGDVQICDNDNVAASGLPASGVLGPPRFMAPEVVRCEAPPSIETDRYSLAVLLFYLLLGGHPLEGQREVEIHCMDLHAMTRLYGSDPLYIFDPSNPSNRPVSGVHDNPLSFQAVYPPSLIDLFMKSFTDGLHYPSTGRVMESIWRKEFVRARDLILVCPGCKAQNFYIAAKLAAAVDHDCWRCRRAIPLPPRIRVEQAVILLNEDTRLYPHHVGHDNDFSAPIAEVSRHPTDPGRWGLKNLSGETWTLRRPDGSSADVPPGRAAPIVAGNVLQFGTATGEMRG